MNMNGLYVCLAASRFRRYFAGSLDEDKTNCNAVRCLPDDDDENRLRDGNRVGLGYGFKV